ncbi:MAG: nucleotide pyrophosphohydrolase [Candidatus Paceibacterota bacterium]
MADWKSFETKAIAFRDARDWKQFNNTKDVALSLVLEATEVMEHFQWKNEKEIAEYVKSHKDDIADELADVVYWVATMAHDLDIDIPAAFDEKLKKNDRKYPVEKAKGKHTKYDKL